MDLSEHAKEELVRAGKLYQQGNIKEALPIMEAIAAEHPEKGILLASLANTYRELGQIERAEDYFKIAVDKSPDSRRISLGYYHLLWEIGKYELAVAEIERFQEHAELTGHYLEIAEEINLKTDYNIRIKPRNSP